jgi:hypothetical protein
LPVRAGEAEGAARSPPDRQQFKGGDRARRPHPLPTLPRSRGRVGRGDRGIGEPGVPASLGRRRPVVQIHLP